MRERGDVSGAGPQGAEHGVVRSADPTARGGAASAPSGTSTVAENRRGSAPAGPEAGQDRRPRQDGAEGDFSGSNVSAPDLRQLVETSGAGVALVSADGVIEFANAALCQMLGRPRSEVVGRHFNDFTHPDDRPAAVDRFKALFSGTPQAYRAQRRFVRSDGSVVWGASIVSSKECGPNAERFALAVIVDITSVKDTERRLAESEERLREAERIAGFGYWELLPATGQSSWSPELFAIHGLAQSDPAADQEALLGLVHPDDRSAMTALLSAPKSVNRLNYRVVRPDGVIRHLTSEVRVDFDEQAAPRRYFAVARDVTEQRAAERALRKERTFSATVLDAAAALVVVMDRSGRIVRCNRTCETMIGHCAADLEGRSIFDFFLSAGDVEVVRRTLSLVSKSQTPALNENAIVSKDGGTRIIAWSYALLSYDEGGPDLVVGSGIDVTEHKRAEAIIRHQASFDALTSLPNRSLFLDRLAQTIEESRRRSHMFSVMFIDLDGFKWINDTLGHRVGDQLLGEVARRLQGCLRTTDTVARLGGDEFAVLLCDLSDASDVELVAEKIRQRLTTPYFLGPREEFISCSVGITVFPLDGEDTETLLRNADIALFRAQEAGRNGYALFHPEMNARAKWRKELERHLHTAVEQNQLVVFYQPIVDAVRRCVVGAEALLRWNHPEFGLLTPDRFIGVAEDTGLIVPIGEWVLRHVCAQGRAWMQTGLPALSMSVNVSPLQCRRDDFADTVRRALADSGLPPELLVIEITEGLMLKDADKAVAHLNALRELGVRIAVDDFGTGYSSLSYLKRLPVDSLKIDRSFIRDLTTDADGAVLVDAIIAMASSFRMQVVGEGVETERQLEFLRARGCQCVQGYLFGKPMPMEDFDALVRGWLGEPEVLVQAAQ